MLLCPACGNFYGGERGLRTHQQIKHESSYGVAKDVVHTAQQQLIVHPHVSGPTALVAQASGAHQLAPRQPGACES
jgi:hypothetical protein